MSSYFSSTESQINTDNQINDELWLTTSGIFTVPYTGYYHITMWGGGNGGLVNPAIFYLIHGYSGTYGEILRYLHKGDKIPVLIGAGGYAGKTKVTEVLQYCGINTVFGDYSPSLKTVTMSGAALRFTSFTNITSIGTFGDGIGGGWSSYSGLDTSKAGVFHNPKCDGTFFGSGGAAFMQSNGFGCAGDGMQGAIRLQFHNSHKKPSDPILSYMCEEDAVQFIESDVAILLHPDGYNKYIWKEEDVSSRLAEGYTRFPRPTIS